MAGAAALPGVPAAAVLAGAAIGLLGARWARLRRQVPARRLLLPLLLIGVASFLIVLGQGKLTQAYRWDLRSPSFGQAFVAALVVRGVGGAALLGLPALLQPNTRRWLAALPCGWAAGTLGAWLLWPLRPPGGHGEGLWMAPVLWAAMVMAVGFLGEWVYTRAVGVRPTFRVALVAVGGALLLTAALARAVYQPLTAQADCGGSEIDSFSGRWGSATALVAVCDSLRHLPHGNEWPWLGRVVLLEGVSRQAVDALGLYLPADDGSGVIELYQVGQVSDATLRRVLAHEYGHHFTTYHLKVREGLDWTAFRRSRWANFRGIAQLPGVGEPDGPYALRAAEIAAEDYAVQFGGAAAPMESFLVAWEEADVPPLSVRPEAQAYWEEVFAAK